MIRYPDLIVHPTEALPPSPETVSTLPNNLFVVASHGVWGTRNFKTVTHRYRAIAQRLFAGEGAGKLNRFMENPAHAKDASDFAVGAIARYLSNLNPDAVAGLPLLGRMFSNPNKDRPTDLKTSFTRTTFAGVSVWKRPPSHDVQEQMMKETWDTFHTRIQAGIETVALETPADEHSLFVDIHDTDIREYKPDGRIDVNEPVDGHFGFPLLVVSNRDGEAAHPYVMNLLGQNLFKHLIAEGLIDGEQADELGFKQNEPYKGAYTTQRYGEELENAYLLRGDNELRKKAQHMHFIQIELNRAMYILPNRRGYDKKRMRRTQQAVANALAETAEAIRHLDHNIALQAELAQKGLPPTDKWRTAPEAGSEAYETAMNLQLLAATGWYNRAEPTAQGVEERRSLPNYVKYFRELRKEAA